jgi:predicted phage terminase large subunit-like protein
MTCNPEKHSFLCQWLLKGGYIDDETGYAVPEMDGVTTYLAEVAGEVQIKKSMQDYIDEYGEAFTKELAPQKFVFYSATVYDNPWIRKHQPSYIGKLKNLPLVERKKLYEGCWFADLGGGAHFKQEWVTMVDAADVPKTLRTARCWDKAGTKPNPINPDPDWTVGIKGRMSTDGTLYVEDVKRFRDRPAVVQATIEETAKEDGKDCIIGIPKDAGAAGKEVSDNSKSRLMRLGYRCNIMAASKSKGLRFEPVSMLGQERKICVVRAPWNKDFFDELESLDFKRRSRVFHDDQADSLSDLWLMLHKKMMVPEISVGTQRRVRSGTRLANR